MARTRNYVRKGYGYKVMTTVYIPDSEMKSRLRDGLYAAGASILRDFILPKAPYDTEYMKEHMWYRVSENGDDFSLVFGSLAYYFRYIEDPAYAAGKTPSHLGTRIPFVAPAINEALAPGIRGPVGSALRSALTGGRFFSYQVSGAG